MKFSRFSDKIESHKLPITVNVLFPRLGHSLDFDQVAHLYYTTENVHTPIFSLNMENRDFCRTFTLVYTMENFDFLQNISHKHNLKTFMLSRIFFLYILCRFMRDTCMYTACILFVYVSVWCSKTAGINQNPKLLNNHLKSNTSPGNLYHLCGTVFWLDVQPSKILLKFTFLFYIIIYNVFVYSFILFNITSFFFLAM